MITPDINTLHTFHFVPNSIKCPDLTRTHLLTELLAQISNLQLLQLQST